ncbi:DNA-methyltransferase [Desulfoscipio gibsoniae]|uniref:Methyltransferase n=1 Tax=Desulfoscipio gibsoniae DSM 7213 TaxID=767817 RepID=R4KB91_9FIRM|nr:site-specific DNA-methyltransferase [Desulfoscipio gibsoniae]AGL00443.1 DNA modification methylase [Desulfoscipio gibsoniae DSM 7213]
MKVIKSGELGKTFEIRESSILLGDAKEALMVIPDKTVQCTVCSPPYWGLRDYGIENQIGAENKLDNYINNLVEIFREVRRVLKDDGTLWLNIGDSYTSGNRKYRAPDRKTDTKTNVRAMSYRPETPEGLKPKDLIGVPWRVAFALQANGWFLRSDIIWNKPNCMPESVKDRPTKCHEYLFLLSKSKHYYYDYQSIKEPGDTGHLRNKRTVWNVNTQAFKEAHFATFPPELIMPCIQAGSKVNDFVLDPFFGSGTVGVVCNELNRRFIGIEINPEYIEMASERIISAKYDKEERRRCNEL